MRLRIVRDASGRIVSIGCRYTPADVVKGIVTSLSIGAAGVSFYWLAETSHSQPDVRGRFGGVVLVLAAVWGLCWFAWRIVRPDGVSMLVANREGLRLERSDMGIIPWRYVEGFQYVRPDQTFLVAVIRDDDGLNQEIKRRLEECARRGKPIAAALRAVVVPYPRSVRTGNTSAPPFGTICRSNKLGMAGLKDACAALEELRQEMAGQGQAEVRELG